MLVTIENGNKEVAMRIADFRKWDSDGKSRIYYELEFTGKRTPVAKFYQIVAGSSTDHVFEVNGRKFGFEYGIDANSNTKKQNVDYGLEELASLILDEEKEEFIASGESRGTSPEVMEAIYEQASGSYQSPERIWEAPTEPECVAIWEMVTKNGLLDDHDFYWGEDSLHEIAKS
jgi:hypothetical protein